MIANTRGEREMRCINEIPKSLHSLSQESGIGQLSYTRAFYIYFFLNKSIDIFDKALQPKQKENNICNFPLFLHHYILVIVYKPKIHRIIPFYCNSYVRFFFFFFSQTKKKAHTLLYFLAHKNPILICLDWFSWCICFAIAHPCDKQVVCCHDRSCITQHASLSRIFSTRNTGYLTRIRERKGLNFPGWEILRLPLMHHVMLLLICLQVYKVIYNTHKCY